MGAAPHGGEAWSCPLFSAFTCSRSSSRDHTCPGPSGGPPADPAARSGGKPALRLARAGDAQEETALSLRGPRLGWLQSWHQILPGPGEAPRPVPFRLGCSVAALVFTPIPQHLYSLMG